MTPGAGRIDEGETVIMRIKLFRVIICILSLAGLSGFAWNAQAFEWTLKVTADGALIHLRPDASSPTAAAAAQGTVLKSYAREGDWFRVVTEAGREGFVILGYISAKDVEIVDKAGPAADFWERTAGEYRGAGIRFRLGGGLQFFGGGDFADGLSGMFDQTIDLATAAGAITEDIQRKSFRSGTQVSADIIYGLSPRLGLGLAFEYLQADPNSIVRVNYGDATKSYSIWSQTDVSAIALGLGVYYDHPLGRKLTLTVHGGPAFHLIDFRYVRNLIIPAGEDDIAFSARAHGFGFRGGLGLELRLNRRSALFIEVRGRVARISDFKGDEQHYRMINLQSWTSKTTGFLYYQEGEGHPRLVVLEEGTTVEGNVRRAAMNLGGASVAAGFRILF